MPAKSILLVNDDPSLLECFQKSNAATVFSTRDTRRLGRQLKNQPFPFIILETKKDWPRDLKRLLNNGNHSDDQFLIVGSSGLLKQNADKINQISEHVLAKQTGGGSSFPVRVAGQRKAVDLALEEVLEHRLKDFVRLMKVSGGRNLHSMLLREIERPLISLTLKETNGNQIQAAHLLGMNRNTLRKKIKELKIRIPKTF